MKVKTIPSGWMRRDGRLDCGPYMAGALEAKIRLEEMGCRKDRLADLTAGHDGGIYKGPMFSRNFVDDPRYGVPFLGSSSMLRADLSDLPLLRKRDAHSAKLACLRIEPGMTLISRSGTIGRMVYARPDMADMWSSEDILKVVPDPSKVPPGYLYAFLSSKFGVPLVTSGTYGAIIQHIEPEHIADLPVPRLGEEIERRAHELVEQAAYAFTNYADLMRYSTKTLLSAMRFGEILDSEWRNDSSALG
jgi:type I restriction enzyme, S subunit